MLLSTLQRYVLREFLRIFAASAIGFPVLVIVLDITENLDKYLARQLPWREIALAYLYGVPDTLFLILPAAVLFATVFAIGGFTRHSEITAAKASGLSFHWFIRPIFVGALLATGMGLVLGAVAPRANARRLTLLQEQKFRSTDTRFNFTFASEGGRVYAIQSADVTRRSLSGIQIERKGSGPSYPTVSVVAREGKWTQRRGWTLSDGVVQVIPDDSSNFSVRFDSLRDRRFREQPKELMVNPKAPQEMGYEELGRFIAAVERSGGDANKLRVERMLKIAIPVTCLIIMLFGAPLATSTQRGGAAYGIGVSLATTVIFLMLVQLTQAIGGKGLLSPELAAWIPSAVFGTAGLTLLARVRT